MSRRRMATLRLAVLCIGALAALPPGALAQQGTAPAGNAARGGQLYYAHGCYGCHGYQGQGRTPLIHGSSPMLGSEELFRTFLRLRADQNPTLPAETMPNYPAETLDDAAVADLYAHIRTFDGSNPAVEDIPVFRQMLDEVAAQ